MAPLPLKTLTTLNRQQLGEVFKDPRTLLAFERIQLYVAQIIPDNFTAFQNLDFVVTAADPSIPNAHVITEGANIDVAIAAGLVTITATPSGASGQIQYNNGGAFGAFTTSGDATINTGTGVLTLATVNSNVGTFGDSTHVSQITVNAKGLVTAASSVAIVFPPPAAGGLVGQIQFNNSGVLGGFDANGDATINVVTGAVLIQPNAVTTGKINNSAVTLAKVANASTNSVLVGAGAAGSGAAYTEIALGSGLTMTGTTLSASGASGTVTSVAMTVPTSVLSVAGSPITTSGTLAVTLATQTANTIFAGPTTGSAAAPTFRAMVTADIPNSIVTLAKIANAAANSKLLGSGASGSGAAYSELTLGTGLTMTGTTLSTPLGTNAAPGILQGDGTTTNVSAGVVSVIGAPVGVNYLTPTLASFTWVNQGSSTATQTVSTGAIAVNIPDTSALNWRLLVVTPPSTPYKVRAQYTNSFGGFQSSQATGIYFYDGTKLMGFEVLLQAGSSITSRVEKIANVTTDSGTAKSGGVSLLPLYAASWFQLRNDGTTLYFDWSRDGQNFVNYYSEAVGTFITPTKIGFGGVSVTGTASQFVYIDMLNWQTFSNANLN